MVLEVRLLGEMSESELNNELRSGKLRQIYILLGEEKYLVRRFAKRIIKKAGGEEFSEFNCQEFPSSVSADTVSDAALALPLFSSHKCVGVSDWDFEAKDSDSVKKITELVGILPDTTTIVFWYPTVDFTGTASAKGKNFIKAAEKAGAGILRFGARGEGELIRLISKEAEKSGLDISRRDSQRILEFTGRDITRILSEMEKLCSYALGLGRDEITADLIEEICYKSTETTAFLMSDALLRGNYEEAFKLLDSLLYQNEEPVAILGALSSAYIDMYRVSVALESGHPASYAANFGDYKGKEFRLRNAERNLRKFSGRKAARSVELLLQADSALKGSRVDGRIILEELLAKLLMVLQGEEIK